MENRNSDGVFFRGNFAYAPLKGHIQNAAENRESQLQNKRDRLTTLYVNNEANGEASAPRTEENNYFGGNQNMKKLLSLALVLTMVLAFTVPALAATETKNLAMEISYDAEVFVGDNATVTVNVGPASGKVTGYVQIGEEVQSFEIANKAYQTFYFDIACNEVGSLDLTVTLAETNGSGKVQSSASEVATIEVLPVLNWDAFWAAREDVLAITHLYYGQEDPRAGCEALDELYAFLQTVESYLWCLDWRPDLATADQETIDAWTEAMIAAVAAYNAHVCDCLHVCEYDLTATASSYDLQNNTKVTFTVTATCDCGDIITVSDTYNVGQDAGTRSYVVGDYIVKIVVNQNNRITSVTVA